MSAAPLPGDDGDPHAFYPARETRLIVASVQVCAHCGAALPPTAPPCAGPGVPEGAALTMTAFAWLAEDGLRVRSAAPAGCLARWRAAKP